jgi:hypothetical protein
VKRVGIALLVLAVLTVGGTMVWRHRVSTNGPVFAGAASETGGRFDVGQPVSFGYVLLRTHGRTRATLERIRLLGVTGGLELLGIQARSVPDEQGKGIFVSVFGYPPPEWPSQPLASQHVVPVGRTFEASGEPNEGLELVIGVRATRAGVARARAVEVTYRAGGRRYRETYDGSMYLCAPKEQFTDETCPGDAHGKFDNASAEVEVPK